MKSVTAHAPLMERIFLLGLLLGGACILLHLQPFDITVTSVSLFGLGVAYILSAYKPIEIPQNDGETAGMKVLLWYGIIPKVLWISSAVSVIAIALVLLNSDPRGYKQMFFIGGSTIAVGLVITVGMAVAGLQAIRGIVPILLRATVLLAVDVYFLLH
jgi:hypothetical protein